MFVLFYYAPKDVGTGEDGLPLYKDVVHIKIHRDATHTVERVAIPEDYERFGEYYKAFEKSHQDYEPVEGFPLEMWSMLKPSDVQNLKVRGIRTVQEFASIAASTVKKFPPEMNFLYEKAKVFVNLAGAGSELTEEATKLQFENEDLKEKLKEARAEIAMLKKAVEAE